MAQLVERTTVGGGVVVLRLLVQFWFKGLRIIIWSRDDSSVSTEFALHAQGPGSRSLYDVHHIHGSGGGSVRSA